MQIEDRRQVEHILPFGFSFLLFYLSFWQAVVLCLAALFYAFFISFHFATTRDSERASRFTSGKAVYALSVLFAILLFFPETGVIAAGWAGLAVGDSFSNLAGRRWGRKRLPWNSSKSSIGLLAFLLTSIPAAYGVLLWHQVEARNGSATLLFFAALAMLVGALLETLPAVIDDNLTITLGSAAVLALLLSSQPLKWGPAQNWSMAILVSAGFAVSARWLGLIRWSGALAGALLGALVFGSFGVAGFAQLLLFFVLGTAATLWGFHHKEKRKIAEPHGGRRGAANAVANGAVPALLSLAHLIDGPGRFWLAVGFSAALATAAFDTVATELGQVYGKTPRSSQNWRRVSPGTPGAISIQGTLSGAVAALIVVLITAMAGWFGYWTAVLCWIAAVLGGLMESLLAARSLRLPELRTTARRHWMNFFNTLIGAAIAMMAAFWLGGNN